MVAMVGDIRRLLCGGVIIDINENGLERKFKSVVFM